MSTKTWTVAEAKAKFSEVLDQAHAKGPQTITKHGRDTAVIIAAEEWAKKATPTGTLAHFFARSPLRRSRLRVGRLKGRLRRVEL